MNKTLEPGGIARRLLLRRAVATVALIGGASRLAEAAGVEVVIDNFTFAPTPLVVRPGTRVTWVNRDDIPHSIVVPSLKVRSHAMDTDQTFDFTFADAGTYDYICGLHPHMMGQLVVRAA